MYRLLRPILFLLAPETAHRITLSLLDVAYATGLLRFFVRRVDDDSVEVMGIRFRNRIGLAAGLDKDADHLDALAACGFGAVEVGTVTPLPQPGNPLPRMFRLVEHEAIINRMGFNNKGVAHLVAQVKRSRRDCVVGINIGKNKVTPNEYALNDYLICLREIYAHADYVTINISSPNTPGLRDLQEGDELSRLLAGIHAERRRLAGETGRSVPVAVKIAPDLDDAALEHVVTSLRDNSIDAVIATNTTNDRSRIQGHRHADEAGGLSGRPLTERADEILARLVELLDGDIPVIAVGGVMTAADARRKIELGASLVQIYSGFVYAGPTLISDSIDECRSL